MIAIMPRPFIDHLQPIPARSLRFAAGEMLVDMGEQVARLMVVEAGMVHLLRFQQDGAAVVLQRAGKGAIVAEASVFAPGYHCAAVAVEDSRLRAWPIAAVRELLERSPDAALAYGRHLAAEVRAARRRAEILALKRVSARLDAWLTWHDGVLPPRGQWQHLADDIGVSREALYRELARRR